MVNIQKYQASLVNLHGWRLSELSQSSAITFCQGPNLILFSQILFPSLFSRKNQKAEIKLAGSPF